MKATSFGSSFGCVDSSRDPAALRDYLDRVRALPAVGAAKRDSFELLELAAGRRVLDVGCGSGDDLAEVADRVGAAGHAAGVDSSEVLVAEAQERVARSRPWVDVVRADAAALPFAGTAFDACRADRTIQHVPDPDAALAELFRVTAPGGVVVVSEMRNVLDRGTGGGDPIAADVVARLWPEDSAQAWIGLMLPLLVARAGFQEVEIHRRAERLTSFEDAAMLLRLRELAEVAVGAGSLDRQAADDWLEGLERDFDAGATAVASEFLHVRGRRPGDAG